MPDDAKFKKLREVGYTIRPCCFFCAYGLFVPHSHPWGVCTREGNDYQHGKHTDTKRLGVHHFGCCRNGFVLEHARLGELQSHGGLFTGDKTP